MVFYTNKHVDKDKAGKAIACFIFIKPEYKDDIGLLIHEQTHVKQFWRKPFTHCYKLLKQEYMLECELEAYANQIEYYVIHDGANQQYLVEYFANKIFEGYGLSGYSVVYISLRLIRLLRR